MSDESAELAEPEWRWCLVGNIIDEHEYGEDHEIRHGNILVIGNPRRSHRSI